jgi:hypothetical protein
MKQKSQNRTSPRPRRRPEPRLIHLSTCTCTLCKGRASVCMQAFSWIDRRDPAHAIAHAKEDLLSYFDRLPPLVKQALLVADVNVCSWCAEIWVDRFGAEKAAQLIRGTRFIDDANAVTPIDG